MIEVSKEANLPTKLGEFKIKIYKEDDKEHAVIYTKNISSNPLIRIHSECLTGDVLSSIKCDCQDQLHIAMAQIYKDNGALLYLRQEGRGIGLFNKINAYHFQDKGMDTISANEHIGFDADLRDYKIVEFILNDLNITNLKILTNNPNKIEYIKSIKSIKSIERIPISTKENKENKDYLMTKKTKMGHLL